MPDVCVKWDTAGVKDARLSVELEGEISSEWKAHFETTIRLLGHGEWGEVKLKKQAIRVRDIAPGSEEKLRHHLEGVVAQANASVEAVESESAARGRGGDGETTAEGPDAEMTRSFRAFAEPSTE